MIRYKRAGNGATITLDAPKMANALSFEMIEHLDTAIDKAVSEGARAIMIASSGKTFCAGGALSDPPPVDAGAILETHLNPLLRKLAILEVPLIAAVGGAAIGAGAALALAADLIIASPAARFNFGFARVGLAPDGGSSWLLARSIGWHRAMAAMLLGEPITAAQAHEWGLVARLVVDDVSLASEADGMLAQIADGPTRCYALARRLARAALERRFEDALDAERAAQGEAGQGDDFREGAAAFRERRLPKFTGK